MLEGLMIYGVCIIMLFGVINFEYFFKYLLYLYFLIDIFLVVWGVLRYIIM